MDARQDMDKSLNNSGESAEVCELVDKIARYLIQNNISQNFLRAALTEVIESWGKNSRLKKNPRLPIGRHGHVSRASVGGDDRISNLLVGVV